jgi:hypothetical protein
MSENMIYSLLKKGLFLYILTLSVVFSEEVYADDNFTFFDENFAINFFAKYNMGIFSELFPPEYRTDKPFDIGIGIRYKTISAKLSVPILFYDFDNIWAFDFEMDSYFDNVYYEAYFKHYPEFYIEDTDKQSGLSIHSSGIMATFIHNNNSHSLSSVISLDRKQNISSGSLLYGFGVFHSSFYSTDEILNKFDARQHLLYFGPSIGYSYTWILKNDIFLNTSLLLYASPGTNLTTSKWLFIPQFEPKIVIGHHNKTWSFNLKMMNNAKFILWEKGNVDILTLVSITGMFSKRF